MRGEGFLLHVRYQSAFAYVIVEIRLHGAFSSNKGSSENRIDRADDVVELSLLDTSLANRQGMEEGTACHCSSAACLVRKPLLHEQRNPSTSISWPHPLSMYLQRPFLCMHSNSLVFAEKEEQYIVEICGVHTPQLFPRLPIANP